MHICCQQLVDSVSDLLNIKGNHNQDRIKRSNAFQLAELVLVLGVCSDANLVLSAWIVGFKHG